MMNNSFDRKPNSTCQMCSKEYYTCRDSIVRKSWRSVSCRPLCHQFYGIVMGLRLNHFDKTDAIRQIRNIYATEEDVLALNEASKAVILPLYEKVVQERAKETLESDYLAKPVEVEDVELTETVPLTTKSKAKRKSKV